MSYIILNNKRSSEIEGLMICSLPPITKPQKRVTIEKINGRDGDIITELGYESYNKELQIGLTYNYDINEVIKYFDSEGIIVFSNEPDKYYKYKIYNQIDFNKLIRFKTAKIKIHVQPFKYALNEEIVDEEITNQEEIIVNNVGLEYSKPIFILYGTGIVHIKLNNVEIFKYTFDDSQEVVIDSELKEAYLGSNLKNRNMLGEFPILKSGENVITWTGNLTRIIVEPKSRWL